METTNTNTTEETMLEARGPDFVAGWAADAARNHKMHVDFVGQSINNVMGTSIPDGAFEGTPDPSVLDIVGNLTPTDLKRVRQHLKGYAAEVREARATQCHFCGQDTGGRECRECG